MTGYEYIKILVEDIHSTTVATIGNDGHPQTRVIDMMHYDEEGIYQMEMTPASTRGEQEIYISGGCQFPSDICSA